MKEDNAYAYMWLKIAQTNGNENGKEFMSLLENVIDRSQVKRAKKLARECIAKDYKGC